LRACSSVFGVLCRWSFKFLGLLAAIRPFSKGGFTRRYRADSSATFIRISNELAR